MPVNVPTYTSTPIYLFKREGFNLACHRQALAYCESRDTVQDRLIYFCLIKFTICYWSRFLVQHSSVRSYVTQSEGKDIIVWAYGLLWTDSHSNPILIQSIGPPVVDKPLK